MPVIKICVVANGDVGPFGWPFIIEGIDSELVKTDDLKLAVSSIIQFSRLIMNSMSFYGNKGGVETSSLFKSYVAECLEELTREHPETAAHLRDLVVVCDALPPELKCDGTWRLERAILAAFPGVRFIE